MVVELQPRQRTRQPKRPAYYTPERRSKARLVEHLNNAHCRVRDLREHDIPEAQVIRLGKLHTMRSLRILGHLRRAPEWDRARLMDALEQELRRDLDVDEWLVEYDQQENQQHHGVDQDVRGATALVEGVALGQDDGPEPPDAA